MQLIALLTIADGAHGLKILQGGWPTMRTRDDVILGHHDQTILAEILPLIDLFTNVIEI